MNTNENLIQVNSDEKVQIVDIQQSLTDSNHILEGSSQDDDQESEIETNVELNKQSFQEIPLGSIPSQIHQNEQQPEEAKSQISGPRKPQNRRRVQPKDEPKDLTLDEQIELMVSRIKKKKLILNKMQQDLEALKKQKELVLKQKEEALKLEVQAIAQAAKSLEVKARMSFYLNETLTIDENKEYEYKHYQAYPFKEIESITLQKTICSYLNLKGGRILIGVNDEKKVLGLKLSENQIKNLKKFFSCLAYSFIPILNPDFVKVYFLPVKNEATNQVIPELYVVKIVIPQGDRTKVYCIEDGPKISCFIKMNAMKKELDCAQIQQLIKKRIEGTILQEEIPATEFEDPKSEYVI